MLDRRRRCFGKKGGGALSGRGEARIGQIGRGSGGGEGTSMRGGSAPRRRGQPRGATSNGGKTTEFPSIGGRRKIEAGVV